MAFYTVVWTINIQADNEIEAAREARKIQQTPSNIACVFDVTDPSTKQINSIDLLDHPQLLTE